MDINNSIIIEGKTVSHNWEADKKYITESEKKNISMKKILVIKPAMKNTKVTLEYLLALRGNKNGISPLSENIKKILGKKL